MLNLSREVADAIRNVFEKPADEEPSRLYGGLTLALGASAMTGSILLERGLIDPLGLDLPTLISGTIVGSLGVNEIYDAWQNKRKT